MPFGVYTGQAEMKIDAVRAPIGRRLLVVAEATNGQSYEPFLYDSKERALLEFKGGPMAQLIQSGFLPYGVQLMRVNPLQVTETLEAIRQSEIDWVYIDNFDVDSETLDEIAAFTETVNDSGRYVHVVLETKVVQTEQAFKQLMGYLEGLSIPTEEGVLELGRQLSVVPEQFTGAGLAYAVTGISAGPGELIAGSVIDHPLEKPISSDWMEMYGKAGIVSFRVEAGETVIARAVNAVQTDSLYRQLFVTRALQWFITEWVSSVESSIGESMTQALYLAKSETERLVATYLGQEVFQEVDYQLSYEEVIGEITCDFTFLPVASVEYMQATAIAKVMR